MMNAIANASLNIGASSIAGYAFDDDQSNVPEFGAQAVVAAIAALEDKNDAIGTLKEKAAPSER
jgi:hypothetical protein